MKLTYWPTRLLCFIGLHSWYDGLTSCYCIHCGDVLFNKPPYQEDDEH